jgi:hypothetical protein
VSSVIQGSPRSVFGCIAAIIFNLAPLLVVTTGTSAVDLYQTSFERNEAAGYNTNLDLVGQNGWLGVGSGGNGLVADFLIGKGQQAYVGYTPPLAGDSLLEVYQPINKTVADARFSVSMSVFDSSNTNWDDFYWTVFNQQGNQLFTIDFDNYELKIYYWLEAATNRTWSGLYFTNGVEYQLRIDMNFASNRWNAVFNQALLATNQPLTTAHSPLNLGDVDAGWGIFYTKFPGDNFMVFDDYQVTATIPQPELKLFGLLKGAATLRLSGPPDMVFAIEASTNLSSWVPIKTNVSTSGYFDFVDNGAAGTASRFYRGRWVP